MIVGYVYTGMLVTGSLHAVLGLAGFITAIAGMVDVPYFRTYYGVAILVSLWVMLVAALGISAGIQKIEDDKIRKLKIAYMVTAILSAVIFGAVGWAMYSLTFAYNVVTYAYNSQHKNILTIGYVGLAIITLEFIMAIVSSSICCCCSGSAPANNTTVIIQAPPQQAVATMQFQGPPNSTIQNQYMGDPTVSYQPPVYHTGNYQQQPYPMK